MLAPYALGAILVAAILAVPVGFFIHQLESDGLQYWLMAQQIALKGSPDVSFPVNTQPFIYAFGVSYVYAPVMAIFHGYAERLRGIQFINIGLICVFFGLAIRYIRAAAPFLNLGTVAALFGLAILVNMRWQATVMLPNSDLIPAIFTTSALLVAGKAGWSRLSRFMTLLCIGTVGLFVKLSLFAIPLVFVAVEAGRRGRSVAKRTILIAAGSLALAAIVFAANFRIFLSYWAELLRRIEYAPGHEIIFVKHIVASVENLWFSAIPGIIVPNLPYLYIDSFHYYTLDYQVHHLTAVVVLGLFVGTIISSTVVVGLIRLWRTRPFDVVLFLVSVPIFAVIPTSTDRYLLVFMPMLWVCVAHAVHPFWKHLVSIQSLVLAAGAACFVLLLVIEGRMIMLRQRVEEGKLARLSTFAYIDNVASIYDETWRFLSREPPEKTRLVCPEIDISYGQFSNGAWTAVTGLPMYTLNNGFPHWAEGHRVLLVFTCRHPSCTNKKNLRSMIAARIKTACYELRTIKQRSNSAAEMEIDELVRSRHCQPR